ncbi:ankyrin repeat protein [Saudi moumouvirus]|uniref:Putative ankyrin repeat protein n=1 Tax=Moumouvirus sp. 'Monve' TaxID=1128131 RepID=H2ED31_9VIRU|nr:putative ankyrin repeat protein [Moumouvirus Monve]AQN68680.1 ankyrin repeat protein [Saudi moumouvirus]
MNTEYYIVTTYNKFVKYSKGKICFRGEKDMFTVFQAKDLPTYFGHYIWSVTLPTDSPLFKQEEVYGSIKVNMIMLNDIYYLLDPNTFIMLQSKGLNLKDKTPKEWCDNYRKYITSCQFNTIYAHYYYKKNYTPKNVPEYLRMDIEGAIKNIPQIIDEFEIKLVDYIINEYDLFVEVLVTSIKKGSVEMFKYLLNEYEKEIDFLNVINLSVENNNVQMLKYLISIQPINYTGISINDTILMSLQKGYLDIYHYLKYMSTNPDQCLETAAFYGRSEIVKELLISGRNPIKALHKAAEGGHFETISVVLDNRGRCIEEIDIDLAITLVKQRINSRINNGQNNNVEEEFNIIDLLESFKCLNSVSKNKDDDSEGDNDYLFCDEDPDSDLDPESEEN